MPIAIWKSHIVRLLHAPRKNLTGRVAQKGGVITVRDVRAKVTKHAENEVDQVRKALDRAEAAELKKTQELLRKKVTQVVI